MQNLPFWTQEPDVKKGWERLIELIESRTGNHSEGETVDEKMDFYNDQLQKRGFAAFGSQVDLALAFLVSTGRLPLTQLKQVIEEQAEAAAFFGDPEQAALSMLALCSQTTFDPMTASAVAEFAQCGFNPNGLTEKQETILGLAASHGRLEMVKALLAIGANPNAVNQKGQTPLLQVLNSPQIPSIIRRAISQILVESGALLDIADEQGLSPRKALEHWKWTRLQSQSHRNVMVYGSSRPS